MIFPEWKYDHEVFDFVFSYELILDIGKPLPDGISHSTSPEGILSISFDPAALASGSYLVNITPVLDQTSLPTMPVLYD